ncbi:hypothetical protein RRG08_006274 [Elysia crispata]|uniref:Uncharacterized protein n=1 Tax=Elysia crispata TaxID=231223 RepID=A0AAE0YPP1_9GAST|nr:hypothetical protein RRG08_006274 [Elysia crispata]
MSRICCCQSQEPPLTTLYRAVNVKDTFGVMFEGLQDEVSLFDNWERHENTLRGRWGGEMARLAQSNNNMKTKR